MAPRVRPRGFELRPGAVRTARLEANLSLAALGGGDISRNGLFNIESGRSRPTLPTLRLIASRTGKPIDYFLEPGQEQLLGEEWDEKSRLQIDELQELVVTANWSAAREVADRLEASRLDDWALARVQLLAGRVRVYQADVSGAAQRLQRAATFFEKHGDKLRLAESLEPYWVS